MSKQKNGFYVAIAGNIGVGKTTLTQLLCDRFGWTGFFEKVVENPYLADFYANMHGWAFQSQIFFLKERLRDHQAIQNLQQACIQDRTIYEDAEIFARNLYERKILAPRDYAVYRDLYEAVKGFLRHPDLIIYLRASTWTLVSRIRKRGREFEQKIDKEYLLQLNSLYNAWISHAARERKVLIIDTDNSDFYRDIEWLESILQEIGELAREHMKA